MISSLMTLPVHSRCFRSTINARKMPPAKHSLSEEDWVWTIERACARKGRRAMLTRALALRRSDKPNPLYYAQRTVDMASARLWLAEGIGIDDIITMLEVRRRFEIPGADLLHSRAGNCGDGSAHDRSPTRWPDSTSQGETLCHCLKSYKPVTSVHRFD